MFCLESHKVFLINAFSVIFHKVLVSSTKFQEEGGCQANSPSWRKTELYCCKQACFSMEVMRTRFPTKRESSSRVDQFEAVLGQKRIYRYPGINIRPRICPSRGITHLSKVAFSCLLSSLPTLPHHLYRLCPTTSVCFQNEHAQSPFSYLLLPRACYL
jgi:hypothetical protein